MEDHWPWTGSQETLVWPPHLAAESQANVPLPLLAQGLFERKGLGEEERIRASWGRERLGSGLGSPDLTGEETQRFSPSSDCPQSRGDQGAESCFILTGPSDPSLLPVTPLGSALCLWRHPVMREEELLKLQKSEEKGRVPQGRAPCPGAHELVPFEVCQAPCFFPWLSPASAPVRQLSPVTSGPPRVAGIRLAMRTRKGFPGCSG